MNTIFLSSTVKKVSEIYDLICQKISGEYIEPTYKISSDKEIKNQYLDNSRIQNDIKIENIFSWKSLWTLLSNGTKNTLNL